MAVDETLTRYKGLAWDCILIDPEGKNPSKHGILIKNKKVKIN